MTPFCAAVDWGTSRFRLWILAGDGKVLHRVESEEGLRQSSREGFAKILEIHLQGAGAPADLPVVICGMAGSRQGWQEAPYLDTPAPLEEIAGAAVRLNSARDIRILPGLAQRSRIHPDVMRGEETQLFGLLSGLAAEKSELPELICMPGTHSKWVEMNNSVVTGFATFMSGEIFDLLSRHSVLANSMQPGDKVQADDPAFLKAVETTLANPGEITNRLFSLRASNLLGLAPKGDGAAGLSGHLIGLELAGAFARYSKPSDIVLLASGNLGTLYDGALRHVGVTTTLRDAEDCGRLGMFKAAESFWVADPVPLKAGSRS